MIVLFSEVINEVLTHRGQTTATEESTVVDSVKLRINQIQDWIFYTAAFEWRKRRFYFNTRAPIEDGTITVTKGSRDVTGSGTSFTDIVKFGYLRLDGKMYKIDPHTSVTTTTFSLAAAFPKTTQSGASYQIVFPEYPMDSAISSILDIFSEGETLDVKGSGRLTLNQAATGRPIEATVLGRSGFTYYSTGTVTLTQGSKTVTGSGTTFTSDMEGMPFRVDEFGVTYTIQDFVSTTEITLRDAYQGDTGAGKSYKISPEDTILIQFRDVPDDIYFMEIEALIKPSKLVQNNEISLIPDHTPLLTGATWLALHDIEGKSVARIQQAENVFNRSLKQLKDNSKVAKNIRWVSEDEIKFRKQGATRFNPLDPRRTP